MKSIKSQNKTDFVEKIDEETAISRLEKLMNIDKTLDEVADIETEDDFEEEVE